MIKPGVMHTAMSHVNHEAGIEGAHHATGFVSGFTLPGFLELGVFVGFLGLFLYIALNTLSKAALIPKNDPYLEESFHHHIGYGGGHEVHHH